MGSVWAALGQLRAVRLSKLHPSSRDVGSAGHRRYIPATAAPPALIAAIHALAMLASLTVDDDDRDVDDDGDDNDDDDDED